MSAIIDMLAFGADMQPDGLSEVDTWAGRILAARALFLAAAADTVVIYGQRVERWITGAYIPTFKNIGNPGRIDSKEFDSASLTLSPMNHAWLAPAYIAADFTLWGNPEAVSYIDVKVARELFGAWLDNLSGTVAVKRGRPPEFPWEELKTKALQLMNWNGEFSADDPKWNAQARLEEELNIFCMERVQREPSQSQLRDHCGPWLKEWRLSKAKAGN
jgi:hypothetical protein